MLPNPEGAQPADGPTLEVLRDIFGRDSGWSDGRLHELKLSPGFDQILLFAQLLAAGPTEEDLQRFLTKHPAFIAGLFGQGDDRDLAFLTKPPVGTKHFADYAILNVGQGGASISLVEIEPCGARLFTQKNTPARRLQTALGQTDDWAQWIRRNTTAFWRDMVARAQDAPRFPESAPNGSFRLADSDSVASSWQAFGGDDPIIRFGILVGRWSKLSAAHRKRLLQLNRQNQRRTIYTYDQLARIAYDRPLRRP